MFGVRICTEVPLPSQQVEVAAINAAHPAHYQGLQAAFYTQKVWPGDTKEIKIQFVDPSVYAVGGSLYKQSSLPQWTPLRSLQYTAQQEGKALDPIEQEINGTDARQAIQKVYAERIQPLVPFRLHFVDQGGDVRITLVGGIGSFSHIGTDCLYIPQQASLNYGWLDAQTIMHEFCHALGMIHEHENPRGNPIQWDLPKLYQYYQQTQHWDHQTTYTNVVFRYDKTQINGSAYDPDSIMNYFWPADITLNDVGQTENFRLSPTDVTWISKTYPGGATAPSTFYQKIYGKSAGPFVVVSGNGGGKNGGGKNGGGKNGNKGLSPLMIGIIVVLVFLLIFLAWFLLIRK